MQLKKNSKGQGSLQNFTLSMHSVWLVDLSLIGYTSI